MEMAAREGSAFLATLQLGLVQWIRGDATLVLKPSKNAWKKHDVKKKIGSADICDWQAPI